jgi:hypothetical protein
MDVCVSSFYLCCSLCGYRPRDVLIPHSVSQAQNSAVEPLMIKRAKFTLWAHLIKRHAMKTC